ncbi:MAG: hypothetical protein JWO38_2010, partial [Gemmataceae bacterium]|nr:hypothetical protein [Gemmataceae bacterium]
MSGMNLFRHLMLTAFRTGTQWPARGRNSQLGRPIEMLEDRTTPAAGGILFGSPAGQTVANLNGPVIAHAHIVEIFWGSGWTSAAKSAVQTAVSSIVAGPYLSAAAQYNAAIGSASVVNTYSITSTNPPAHFTGADVNSFLAANLKDFNPLGSITESAMTDPNAYYFVFTQPGSTDPAENLGGEHTYLSNGVANYHVGWTENVGGTMQQMMDDVTTIFSHELVEAVTDPEGNGTQVTPTNGAIWNEVADNAAENYDYRLGGYKVQAYLSVADNAYIVPTGVTQSLALDSSGRLTITGDQLADKNDAVALSLTATGGVQVVLNGETTRFDPGTISSIVVAGGAGANTLTLDFANGDPTLGGKLTYTGITALAVVGTAAGNNTFAVSGTGGGGVAFSVNGQSFTAAPGVTSVSVTGRGNNNTLTVDYSVGTISAAVNADGGGGTNNTLILQGGSFAAGTYSPTGSSSGTVQLTGGGTGTAGLVTYSNLSAVTDTTTVAAYAIAGTAGNDTIGIIDGPVAGQTQVNSGGTFGPVNFANKTAVTVAALGGADTITLNNPHPATGLAGLTVDAGAGGGNTTIIAGTAVSTTVTSTGTAAPSAHDVVAVGNATTGVRSVLAALTVSNPAALTDLTIDDTADSVGRTIAVTSTSATGLAPAAIGYDPTGLGALTVLAGNGGNTFTVTGTAPGSANTFTGGAGADTFDVTGGGLGAGSTDAFNGGANTGPAGDTFNVSPSATGTIAVNGNRPGGTLNVNVVGTTNPFLASAGGAGSYTFGGGLKPINFTQIQTLQVPTNYLTVTVTDGRTAALPGTPVTYTVTVTNNSSLGLAGVAISDVVPTALIPATVSVTVTGTGPHSSASIGPTGSCTAAIAAGESITFTVTGRIDPSATGTIVDTAAATVPAGLTDSVLSDNTATDTDALAPTADVSVTNTDGVTSATPGASVTYTVVVTNTGPGTAAGVSVADAVPAGVTGFTWTSAASAGASGSAGSGSGSIGEALTLLPAAAVTYTITATIDPAAVGTLTNTATAAVAAGTTDPVPANNTATDVDALAPIADVSVTNSDGVTSATPGTSVTYTVVVTNTGPGTAAGVSVADAVPAGVTGFTWTSAASA